MTTENSCNGNWLFQISMKVASMSFLLKHRKGIWSGLYFGSRGRRRRLEYGSLKMLSRYGVILERDERCSVTIICPSIPSEIPMQALSFKIAFGLAKYGRKLIASCYINFSSCCCQATGGREYIPASSKSFRLVHWPWSAVHLQALEEGVTLMVEVLWRDLALECDSREGNAEPF